MRLVFRFVLMIGVFAGAGFEQAICAGWRWGPRERADWLQRWARRFLRALGFRVTVRGNIPSSGFLAPNHLGYMDIVVLASISPQVFLSKSEVRSWPIVGLYTRMAGTLYIDRNRRSDVANKADEFERVIEAGLTMTFFLEGTSTDGRTVLPFRSSLLQPVVSGGWPITATYLRYECLGGDAANDVCWWGEAGFGEHLARLLQVEQTRAEVVFGHTRLPGTDRKQLAYALYEEVLELGSGSLPCPENSGA